MHRRIGAAIALIFLIANPSHSGTDAEYENIRASGFSPSNRMEWAGVQFLMPGTIPPMGTEYSPTQPLSREISLSSYSWNMAMTATALAAPALAMQRPGDAMALGVGGAAAGAIGTYYANLAIQDFAQGVSDVFLPFLDADLTWSGQRLVASMAQRPAGGKQWLVLVVRAYGIRSGFFSLTPYIVMDTYVFEGDKPVLTTLQNGPGPVVKWSSNSTLVYKKTTLSSEKNVPLVTDVAPLMQNPVLADSVWNHMVRATVRSAQESLLAN